MEWGQKLATWWLVGEIQNISLFGTLVSSRGHKNRTKKLKEREREREREGEKKKKEKKWRIDYTKYREPI